MSITKKGSFNLGKKLQDFNSFKRRIPVLLGNEARNHFLEGFRKSGRMTDESRSGWKARKQTRSRDRGRKLLVKTGDLRADLQRRQTSFRRTSVSINNIPYATYHNEGAEHLPQREIIGDSKDLERKIEKIINRELKL